MAVVCYVIGHYASAGHTVHLRHFFEAMASHVTLDIIVWSYDDEPLFAGARATYLLKRDSPGKLRRALRLLRLGLQMYRRGCRIFIVRIFYPGALLLSMLRLGGARVYLWHSGMWDYQPERTGALARVRKALRWWAGEAGFWLTLHAVTRLVTGPPAMADYYVRRFRVHRARVCVLDNDVDVDRLVSVRETRRADAESVRTRLGLGPAARLLLYVGAVSALRFGGRGMACGGVLETLMNRRGDVHVLFTGRISLPEAGEWSARWGDRVHFAGPQNFDSVLAAYLASDVFIFPVVAAGFPRVLLESMALGVPFVSFDVGGVVEIVGPAQRSCVVPVGEAKQFVERVCAILDDSSWRRALIENGMRQVRRFSTDIVVRRWLDALCGEIPGA